MNEPAEHREFLRLPFKATVSCLTGRSDKKYTGMLCDVSITGFFMETDDYPDVGEHCSIEITLEGNHSRLMIDNISGSIVRSDENGVAIIFDERLEWFSIVPLCFKKLRDQLEA